MNNLILALIAIFLFILLEPISFVYVVFIKEPFTWKRLSGYWRGFAIAVDRFGNYQYKSLWNRILIKDNGYKFGDFRETISSALGKNEVLSKIVLKVIRIKYLSFTLKNWKPRITIKKKKIATYRKFLQTPYTRTGILLNRILNFFDKEHCKKSINEFN